MCCLDARTWVWYIKRTNTFHLFTRNKVKSKCEQRKKKKWLKIIWNCQSMNDDFKCNWMLYILSTQLEIRSKCKSVQVCMASGHNTYWTVGSDLWLQAHDLQMVNITFDCLKWLNQLNENAQTPVPHPRVESHLCNSWKNKAKKAIRRWIVGR